VNPDFIACQCFAKGGAVAAKQVSAATYALADVLASGAGPPNASAAISTAESRADRRAS